MFLSRKKNISDENKKSSYKKKNSTNGMKKHEEIEGLTSLQVMLLDPISFAVKISQTVHGYWVQGMQEIS